MPAAKPKSVGDFLRKRKLIGLYREVEAQKKLLDSIRPLLPNSLGPHCTAAHLREGQMVLFTDSPAWASRLRYSIPEIQEKMVRAGIAVSSVRIRVNPSSLVPPREPRKANRLSAANAELLLKVATTIDDPALGAVLRRLGRYCR